VVRELQVFGSASPIPPPSPYSFTATSASGSTGKDAAIATNLIQNGQATLASVSAPIGSLNGTFSVAGLNDGSVAAGPNLTYYSVSDTSGGATTLPVTITFNLNTAINKYGYDLSSIQALTGWGDHNLGAQRFQLLLALGNGAFVDFGTYTNAATVNGGNSSFLSTVSKASGALATNVTGIRFVFQNPDKGNGAGTVGSSQAGSSGGTVIRELQAFGTPSAASLSYNTWAGATYNLSGANALPSADPDGDGFTNFREFVFGTSPSVQGSTGLAFAGNSLIAHGQPVLGANGSNFTAIFDRRKDYVAAGLTYTVQFSADLVAWEDSATTPAVVASDSDFDAVQVPYPLSLSTGALPQFFRVKVTAP